jgi:hypothetical protein
MWAWVWTTSGSISSSTAAVAGATSHGMHTWKSGRMKYECERTPCTVTPSCTTLLGGPLGEGATTWTSCPRPARPPASRSANRAAPLTSGG